MTTIQKIKNEIMNNWTKSEKAWLIFATLAILVSTLYDKASLLEISTGLIGIVYVILIAKGYNISNMVGIVYVTIYGIIAWQAKFYGDMLMNIILIPLYIIAFIQWKKHTKNGVVEARNLNIKQTVTIAIMVIAAMFLFNMVLVAMGGNYTWADSANSILTITAMALTIGRYSQQWICWLTNNVISTSMWVLGAMNGIADISISIVVLKVLILGNSIWGLVHWFSNGAKKESEI